MKKYMALGLCVVLVGLFAIGCAKKEQPLEQMQEPLPVEVAPMSTTAPATGTQAAPVITTAPAATVAAPQEGIALPPQGPYKPTNEEIQTALKNAGFYAGEVDGKVGPKTKKAIEAFQTANNLKADGKVGPKTWSLLSAHLTPAAVPAATSTTR
jgi:peptidoglycan hydrolase-like protein with peptidoglycan-binding domain